MQEFTTISAALTAFQAYVHGPAETLDDGVTDLLMTHVAQPSPVAAICNGLEVLFANREDLDAAGKELCASLASFATSNGWHGLAADERGVGMIGAVRRDLGHTKPGGGSWPSKADDPAGKSQFTKPKPKAPVAEPETPPEGEE